MFVVISSELDDNDDEEDDEDELSKEGKVQPLRLRF